MDYWDRLGAAFDQVDIYNGADAFFAGFAPLPAPVQHLFAAHWCQSEVNNGGFDQFFFNSTGVLAPEAEAGFRAIGLTGVADIVREAMARFGAEYPREQEVREAAMDAIPSDGGGAFGGKGRRFSDLDDRFYEAMADRDFQEAADAYAERHCAG